MNDPSQQILTKKLDIATLKAKQISLQLREIDDQLIAVHESQRKLIMLEQKKKSRFWRT